MKIIKISMRLWITLASVVSFLIGWVLLAHAEKPAPLQFNSPSISSPASSPLFQSDDGNFRINGTQFTGQFQPRAFGPMLRTGGS